MPSDPRPTVLLTGFGPFPGVSINASADLVRAVVRPARRAFPKYRFVAAVLPTEWDRAPRRIADLHKRHDPVLGLHFGVVAGSHEIRLETRAENICRASADAVGQLPLSGVLRSDGPAERRVTIDLAAIANGLEVLKIPCSLSNNAGGYLCNAVLYHSLECIEARGSHAGIGFVHIPADLSVLPQSRDGAIAAALAIIAVSVAQSHAIA